MAERKIRHVEEIFSGRGVGDGRPNRIFEKKSSFNNIYKNKRAPDPPSGQNGLPKIGNYQPKIYLEPTPGAPESESKKIVTSADVHRELDNSVNKNNSNNRNKNNSNNNTKRNSAPVEINKDFFIIGDKDIPMIIEEKSDLVHEEKREEVKNDSVDKEAEVFNDDSSSPVPMPRRKRRAPSAPDVSEGPVTSNPLFGRSLSQSSDTTRLDNDFDVQGGDIDFAYGIDNPGYGHNDYSSSKPRAAHDAFQEPPFLENGLHKSSSTSMPYIPPPDYDDEEMTMDFDEEPELNTLDIRQSRSASLYKDYEGEDFGKYLVDDMDNEPEPLRNRRGGPEYRGGGGKDQKFLPKPPHKDKRHSNKPKKKNKKDSDMKRNTIRDFTFTDSKIGWGDRTVKSTSAKGRYIKREKDRRRIDMTENTAADSGPGSYEEFLRMKNDLNKPADHSPNSSDSGVEVGDESQLMDMYLHSQPKQYKMASKYEHRKPSVWKRLTLRFKKSVTVTKSGDR